MRKNLYRRWKLSSLKQAHNPFARVYTTELDASTVIDPLLTFYYQSQIGVLKWMVELGRLDINTEVLMLNSCLDLPREGHIEAVLYVYGYLHENHKTGLALDPYYLDIN